jgi:hypothetical protein
MGRGCEARVAGACIRQMRRLDMCIELLVLLCYNYEMNGHDYTYMVEDGACQWMQEG